MAMVFGEGSFSYQADLTVHLSCPPFHLMTLLMTQVGKNWVVVASRGRNLLEQAVSTVPAQKILPGRLCVPAGEWGPCT